MTHQTLIHSQGIKLLPEQYKRIGSPSRVSLVFHEHDAIVVAGTRWAVYEKSGRPSVSMQKQPMADLFHMGPHESEVELFADRLAIRIKKCVVLYRREYERYA